MKKICVVLAAAVACAAAMGEGDGPWRLTVGGAWRAGVKSRVSGYGEAGAVKGAGRTETREGLETVQDPDYPGDARFTKYAKTVETVTTTVERNAEGARFGETERDGPAGLKASAGYDVWKWGDLTVAVKGTVAGYWNMGGRSGAMAGGGRLTETWAKDYYLYSNGPVPGDTDFTGFAPDAAAYGPYGEQGSAVRETYAPGRVWGRLSCDLYQIGAGPEVRYEFAEGVEAYGAVQALFNMARMELEGSGGGKDAVDCMGGVGAHAGVAARVWGGVGLFGEVGYEWVDEARVRGGGMKAEADFSGLVLSLGASVNW